MLDIFGGILAAPFRVADAGARVVKGSLEAMCDEDPRVGKTMFGHLADEIEDALKDE